MELGKTQVKNKEKSCESGSRGLFSRLPTEQNYRRAQPEVTWVHLDA